MCWRFRFPSFLWYGALYTLVVPPELWDRLFAKPAQLFRTAEPSTPSAQATEPKAAGTAIWNHRYAIYGVASLLICMSFLQSLIILQDHQIVTARKFTLGMRIALNRYTGLCMHGVFLDAHWNNYDHVVALVHQRGDGTYDWLPLTLPNGQMEAWRWIACGRWAFRANMPGITNPAIEKSVKRLTAYWLAHQARELHDAKFLVLTKALRPCTGWRENELTNKCRCRGKFPAKSRGIPNSAKSNSRHFGKRNR